MRRSNERRGAFTLIEVLVTVAIISILVSVGYVGFLRYRHSGVATRCVANLRMLQNAREAWASDNPMSAGVPTVTASFWQYLPVTANVNVACPDGGNYRFKSTEWTDLAAPPTCPNWVSATDSPYYGHRLQFD